VFFEDEDRMRYVNLLAKYSNEHGMRILGYCLMNNHVHIVAVPAEKESLSRAMKSSQLEHASYINQKYARCGHLWHGRFYSCPMDLDHTISALSYVELNPVRAGMVVFPWDYTWSSAPAHCGGRDRDSLLDLNRWFSHFKDSEWRDGLMIEMENRGFLEKIRQHTRNGRPLGDRAYFRRWLPDT
jgi:putative transposase